MTKNKKLVNMRKELRNVKHKMIKYNKIWVRHEDYDKSMRDYCFPKNIKSYVFITKDGKKYLIDRVTKNFPNIKFKNIIYICEYYASGYDNIYDMYDNINKNQFDTYEYIKYIDKKYKVTTYIGFERD